MISKNTKNVSQISEFQGSDDFTEGKPPMDYKNKNLRLKEEKLALENAKFQMDLNMQRSVSKPDLSFKSSVQNSQP